MGCLDKDAEGVKLAQDAINRLHAGKSPVKDPVVKRGVKAINTSVKTRGKKPDKEYKKRFKPSKPIHTKPGDPEVLGTLSRMINNVKATILVKREGLGKVADSLREAEKALSELQNKYNYSKRVLDLAVEDLENHIKLYDQLRSLGTIDEITNVEASRHFLRK